jgi:hypothetical protein
MEYWEVTKARAVETLPVWTRELADTTVGVSSWATLAGLIDGFEPRVQACVAAVGARNAASREVQGALGTMRLLGMRVPQLIEGLLAEDARVMQDLRSIFRGQPRNEKAVLARFRALLPVWERANAVLAGVGEGVPPIVRPVGGVVYSVAVAGALLEGYPALVAAVAERRRELNLARSALRAHDKACDELNKRFYRYAKAVADVGSPLAEALAGVTKEPGWERVKKAKAGAGVA